jgi:hypothetical protein
MEGFDMMNLEEASRMVGRQPRQCIANMRRALELHTWNNTADDWQRLEACYVFLCIAKSKRLQTSAPDGSIRSR